MRRDEILTIPLCLTQPRLTAGRRASQHEALQERMEERICERAKPSLHNPDIFPHANLTFYHDRLHSPFSDSVFIILFVPELRFPAAWVRWSHIRFMEINGGGLPIMASWSSGHDPLLAPPPRSICYRLSILETEAICNATPRPINVVYKFSR
jgi:hypothetical protein